MTTFQRILLILWITGCPIFGQQKFPKIDQEMQQFRDQMHQLITEFQKIPPNPHNKAWVKQKLKLMATLDQNFRKFEHRGLQYPPAQRLYFFKKILPIWRRIDQPNVQELKKLVKIYKWFRISEFGKDCDTYAWLIIQHADFDTAFQKQILKILEQLYPTGETNPRNYAYLYDRVAVREGRAQRYGTQGRYINKKWRPYIIEDYAKLNIRRKKVGLKACTYNPAEFIKPVKRTGKK